MKLINQALLQFEKVDWRNDPELGLIDLILTQNPHLIKLLSDDITQGQAPSVLGRQDSPSVDQVVRAGIFKEFKKLNYRDLDYMQRDSYVCKAFLKLDGRKSYSFQVWNKYISRISAEKLTELLFEINKIAIKEGIEDLDKIRMDTTVVESNIHAPTNNSLVWDCIKESHRLLAQLAEQEGIKHINYSKGAKKNFFAINNSKADKRTTLFVKQLKLLTKTINQVSRFAKKKDYCTEIKTAKGLVLCAQLDELLPLLDQVYQMTYQWEVLGEKVSNDQKVFSIYEQHTDIIVKGRKSEFGHKVLLSDSKSGLILGCEVLKGNPSDSTLFNPTLSSITDTYGKIPRSVAADGGFAAHKNLDNSLVNVVFNKVTPRMRNRASSKNMETRLRKWRSGIEASISNLKRGFNIGRCSWKGWKGFCSKVMWSVIGYNFRVLSQHVMARVELIQG